jgi:type II restriction/modification system DNA methylase subunit YeeA
MSAGTISPQIDIDGAVACIRGAVDRASNEEEVKIGILQCLVDTILRPLNLRKEDIGLERVLVSGGRVDALYGKVLIEFKARGRLTAAGDIERAVKQVEGYITQMAADEREYTKYLGVLIGDRIIFVRYDRVSREWRPEVSEITREAILKFVEALRGLERKPLNAANLVRDFGPNSEVARTIVPLLYERLVASKSPRTRTLFDDWLRLFRQTTGYDPAQLKELPRLAKMYGLGGDTDYDALIFSIHTYYALLLKLIAAEIAYIYGAGRFLRSYVARLDEAYTRGGVGGLGEALRELEDGGIFRRLLRVENFLEGDYFAWYLDGLDANLGSAIAKLIGALSDYEVATPHLEPEFARDLLKELYQNLMPGELRHGLGEFYTPDWLAELLLDEVGLSPENLEELGRKDPEGPLKLRVLDPACGSGTFLMLYLARLRAYAERHYLTDKLAEYVLNNVVGYDLNPLAVLTARTNYLLEVADLLARAGGTVEIPVYLADSIMVERRFELSGGTDNAYVLRTTVGDFSIPAGVVERGLLRDLLTEVYEGLKDKYSADDFRERISYAYDRYGLNQFELDMLVDFYNKLRKLEEEGKNGVWISVIRNAFAPILRGKFDHVVGNPPWINWESLPEQYREASKSLWEQYGLVGTTARFKRDLAMLFLVRSFDLYLREGGRLGFLLTFTAFKAQAGAGFRRFLANKTRILAIHDVVALRPFEGATNRTGAIVVEKVCELNKIDGGECRVMADVQRANRNGVRHIIWTGEQVDPKTSLAEVLRETRRHEAIMMPVDPRDPASPWMQVSPRVAEVMRGLMGGNQNYEAHAGVYTSLNQVYFIKILGREPDGTLIATNPPEPGQKKNVEQAEARLEPDLIYPLLRGRDVKRWCVEFGERYIIIPHQKDGKPISRKDLIKYYPNTFSYLAQYKDLLEQRTIKPFLSIQHKLHKAKSSIKRQAMKKLLDEMFYIVDNIGAYTFAPYKVVWGRISGSITGKATSFGCAVAEPIDGRPAVPDDSLIMVPTYNPDEAYYIAGVLNSIIARVIIASYTYELRQETHILEHVKIPRFDPRNPNHMRIAELSKRAHELARRAHCSGEPDPRAEGELGRVEEELDAEVARLFGLSEEDLGEFRELMSILSGGGEPTVSDRIAAPTWNSSPGRWTMASTDYGPRRYTSAAAYCGARLTPQHSPGRYTLRRHYIAGLAALDYAPCAGPHSPRRNMARHGTTGGP